MIRQVLHTTILLFAIGNCSIVFSQNVTTLTSEPINASGGLSVDAEGNIFIANQGSIFHDGFGREVYKVTSDGQVSLFAEGFLMALGNAFDSQGNLYQSSYDADRVDKITPSGTVTRFAGSDEGLDAPTGMAFDSQGNLYVGNCGGGFSTIIRITPEGDSSVFAGGEPPFDCPTGLAFDDHDNLYVTNWYNTNIVKVTPEGVASVFADSSEWTPAAPNNIMMTFANGRFYFAGYGSHRVYELTLEGEIKPLAGSGEVGHVDGELLQASLQRPYGLDSSPDGRFLYVSTQANDFFQNPGIRTPNHIRVIELPDAAPPFQINAGHSGAWYNRGTSGQGLLLDVEPADRYLFLAWFTYTDADSANPGEPHWFTAQGNYSGDSATLPVYRTLGGRFDDPQAVSGEVVGELTLQFDNCNAGTVSYAIDDWQVQGAFPIERLIPGSDNICQQNLGPALQAVDINPGMDGSWYDPDASGQGLLLDVHADASGGNYIFAAWFTYGDGTASGHRWLTAQGGFEGSAASIDLSETTGGLFDDAQPVSTGPVGSMTIDFIDCSNATFSYTLANEEREGIIDLTRLLPKGKSLCEGIAIAR